MKNTFIVSILLILVLILSTFTSIIAQVDYLKVMYYNTLNYPDAGDPNREDNFRTVNSYVQADIILINELTSYAGAVTLLNDALNVYGTTHYQKANYTNGPDTDNMLFYNSEKLALHSQWYIPTSLRHINEYVLYYKSDDLAAGGDTIFFYFYSAHLKAFPEDSLQRLSEVNDFISRVSSLSNAENVFFGGDMNFYTNAEPAYQALINDGSYPLHDPLPAAEWHNNYSYRFYHSQSTRTSSFGGGSTGGMDDRFDFILFSDDVLNGTNKVEYVNGSCEAFGNDGNHFNDALIDTPLNPNIPDSVTYALYNMSDHLPVICDLKVSASPDTTSSEIVITEIMYNPPESGTDSLEFIELYNDGSASKNLAGFSIAAGIDFTFPSVSIDPGEFLVVAVNSSAMMNTFGVTALQWTSGGLVNGGELILLEDASGQTIDSVHYDDSSPWPTQPDGNGPSLILCNPQDNNALGANWDYSLNFVTNNGNGDPIYATPGFSECDFPPTAAFSADQTEIFVGGSVNFTDLSTNNPTSWLWTFEGGTPPSSTDQNPMVNYNTAGVYDVTLNVSNAAGSDETIVVDYITVSEETSGDLMVTEIMQNPNSVGDAEGEWFEIFNPNSSPVDMNGWYVKDNDYDSIKILSSLVVPANGFVTLGINASTGANGNYICDYEYSNFFLANGADEVVLFNSNEEEVDRVEYDGGANWPDPNGASMIFTGSKTDDNNNYQYWDVATLREPSYAGTLTDVGSPGTNGTGQNLITLVTDIDLDIKVYLEGPFNGTNMNTDLTGLISFPLSQPYNVAPWMYMGTENVGSIPPEVVDWILVELRDAADANSATPDAVIEQKAAFLLSDGSVVDLDGTSILTFNHSLISSLFVVIWHRNHLGVMSANPLSEVDGTFSYDFSSALDQAFDAGQKFLSTGKYGMISGDVDASGLIEPSDKTPSWDTDTGTTGYLQSDLSLDTQVNNQDKNDYWLPNLGEGSQVPE